MHNRMLNVIPEFRWFRNQVIKRKVQCDQGFLVQIPILASLKLKLYQDLIILHSTLVNRAVDTLPRGTLSPDIPPITLLLE